MTDLKTSWQPSTPEAQLVLACSRTHVGLEVENRIRALAQSELHWDRVLLLAQVNNVVPLLYKNVNAVCPELVPPGVLSRLRLAYYAGAKRNDQLTAELFRLLREFEAHAIPAIPIKGPVLAASAYGDISLRSFDDLDVLLDGRHVPEQKALMQALGYSSPYDVSPEALRRLRQGLSFSRTGSTMAVDLHWGIELHWSFTPRVFSQPHYSQLWERLEPVTIQGHTIQTLSPEDCLLLLAVHGAKHRWVSLRWICDVAELVRAHPKLDWDALLRRGTELHAERMLSLALMLARDALDAPLPAFVSTHIDRNAAVRALAHEVPSEVFALTRPNPDDNTVMERFHLRVLDTVFDRVRYCLQIAVKPTVEDWDLIALPRSLFAGYYVVRPVRLVGKYGHRLWSTRRHPLAPYKERHA